MPHVGANRLDIPNHFPTIANAFLIGFYIKNKFCGYVLVISPNKGLGHIYIYIYHLARPAHRVLRRALVHGG